jgi:ADP-ribose pyrophosphatase YjhB (NUDIX family)
MSTGASANESTTPEQAVGAVVFDPEGRVLLVRRGTPPLHGTWTLPGGRLLPGESPEAAVVREVLEETGLTVRAGPLVERVILREEGYAYAIDDYLCTPLSAPSAIRAGDDALEVRWAASTDLEALGVRPLAIAVVDRARRLDATG